MGFIIDWVTGNSPGNWKESCLGISHLVTLAETRAGVHVKCPILLSDFDENWNVLANFNDISNIAFYKNSFNQYRIVTLRKDRQTNETVQ
jgi:hypothetical protein